MEGTIWSLSACTDTWARIVNLTDADEADEFDTWQRVVAWACALDGTVQPVILVNGYEPVIADGPQWTASCGEVIDIRVDG